MKLRNQFFVSFSLLLSCFLPLIFSACATETDQFGMTKADYNRANKMIALQTQANDEIWTILNTPIKEIKEKGRIVPMKAKYASFITTKTEISDPLLGPFPTDDIEEVLDLHIESTSMRSTNPSIVSDPNSIFTFINAQLDNEGIKALWQHFLIPQEWYVDEDGNLKETVKLGEKVFYLDPNGSNIHMYTKNNSSNNTITHHVKCEMVIKDINLSVIDHLRRYNEILNYDSIRRNLAENVYSPVIIYRNKMYDLNIQQAIDDMKKFQEERDQRRRERNERIAQGADRFFSAARKFFSGIFKVTAQTAIAYNKTISSNLSNPVSEIPSANLPKGTSSKDGGNELSNAPNSSNLYPDPNATQRSSLQSNTNNSLPTNISAGNENFNNNNEETMTGPPACVYVWKTQSGKYLAHGPTQKISISTETLEEALKYAFNHKERTIIRKVPFDNENGYAGGMMYILSDPPLKNDEKDVASIYGFHP